MDNSRLAVNTYNKIAARYAQQYFDDLTDIPYIQRFLFHLEEGSRILDIGCGAGNFSKYVFDQGFKVEGIDLSSEMLNVAKRKVTQVNFRLMDMREMSFPPDSFDGLLVAYSLIHIPSQEVNKTLKGFCKVLKPGGYVLIITQKGEADRVVDEPLMQGEKTFVNFFTQENLKKHLKESGFVLVSQEETDSQDPEGLSDRVIYTIAQKPL